MDTRISPAGTGYPRLLIQDDPYLLLEYTLNGQVLFLELPSLIIGSIVSNNKFNRPHVMQSSGVSEQFLVVGKFYLYSIEPLMSKPP